MTEEGKRYLLLQLNDALFPIGGYSHSYGLETYIQKGLITGKEEATAYIRNNLQYNLCQNELLAARLAWEAGSVERLRKLDELVTASRTPKEVRLAGEKLGSRFLKTVRRLPAAFEDDVFQAYAACSGSKNHAVVYGAFCASAGISTRAALEHYLYAQTSAMVTNCVKSIPLSQMTGQEILFSCQEIWPLVMKQVYMLTEEDYGAAAPGFEIRCMQHEGLYSRIYMS